MCLLAYRARSEIWVVTLDTSGDALCWQVWTELDPPSPGTKQAPVLTGKGSEPSWITKPSIRWVRMWDLTKAWAGLLSPLCWLLLVFPFPEVMTGAVAAPHLSTQAWHGKLNKCWPLGPGHQQLLCTYTMHAIIGQFNVAQRLGKGWQCGYKISVWPATLEFGTNIMHLRSASSDCLVLWFDTFMCLIFSFNYADVKADSHCATVRFETYFMTYFCRQ